MKVLDVSSLSFSYDDGTCALSSLDMSLSEGEKVAIIGPNGAGKSTLLHLIAGFRMPFEGIVTVMGRRLDEHTAEDVRRSLGLLFQDPDDQIFMPTVEEDVAFGPTNLGMDRLDEMVTAALRNVGIEQLRSRRPHRLSHGMKKRVAIAGVLAMDPSILLLDEPTAGLDPKSRTSLVDLLNNMRKSMLIATHDLEAAAAIADRVVLLRSEALFEGTMAQLVSEGNRKLLEESGLELPQLSKLFTKLGQMGYSVSSVPVTLEQGVAETARILEREREGDRRNDP